MSIKAEEISSLIKKQLEHFDDKLDIDEVGVITYVGDGIARAHGLNNVLANELLEFENGSYGIAQNLETNDVGIIILGKYDNIREGDRVKRTGRIMEVPVGEALIGRVVNPLGQPVDGLGEIKTDKTRPIESKAPGVMDRQSVNQPLQTGIKAIDALVPIGRGQRELIIGDRKTGKTSLAIDTILNQKGQDVICIYVAIGQKESTIRSQVETLKRFGAMDYTIVVEAGPSAPAPLLYIAPYAGTAMGEEFMYNGKDVLIVFDDLSKQAVAYRELSLLIRRPPGREAYPGDVFYIHSRLLERSAKLSDKLGGGSLTALPFIQTEAGDISAYIPTNVISITDGQIFLQSDLFFAGTRPAIDAGASVSRVGGSAQIKAMKKVAGTLRVDLASFRELESFAQFGSDLDQATQAKLNRGRRIVEVLKQPLHEPLPVEKQVLILYALTHGFLDSIPVEDVARYEHELDSNFESSHADLLKTIRETGDLPDEDEMNEAIKSFNEGFTPTSKN
ncbi:MULTISPECIES: F0F1 ATP synthase subunit alpha [Lactobacillus]|uniref:ATP synthase subunit alpha n=1 Tax=Lactobacillus mulieris TaxID=2508708 RepID=A0AAP3GR55_9LACO|nr:MULTISPECIES: F0F1 ATP synthase subunit alpha [Lactobacillus]EEU21149.1 ATP synthase subunit alpha [Lactobacillus jensenii 27-2-CHN]EEX24026.1 ATP synthase F1, alpha subunit [Lactobacillus jensenii 115-3-CHN]KAA9243491.1 F0F1 ATP synthase subunit alpha [Lactobacillus jensenii]KAA9368478.1 F0F1 ATP synthase subunit alpha [Lactobacillus jensenii]KAA9372320.1 F0F1 ATP synthase subunit alpha [Lactobacillus jensenii]